MYICIDIYHTSQGAKDLQTWLGQHAPQLVEFQLSDWAGAGTSGPGRWFHTLVAETEVPMYDHDEDWQTAWHGTSLYPLPSILRHGLRAGPSGKTANRGSGPCYGVYSHPRGTLSKAGSYMKYVPLPDANTAFFYSCVLELLVCRCPECGKKCGDQWVQPGDIGSVPRSVVVTAVWFHMVHYSDFHKDRKSGQPNLSIAPRFVQGSLQ